MSKLKIKYWLLATGLILALLLLSIMLMPSTELVRVKHDNSGWSINSRPITEITKFGLTSVNADFIEHSFESTKYGDLTTPCPNKIGHGYGLFYIYHYYEWSNSEIDDCIISRNKIKRIKPSLSAALLSGDPKQVKQNLDSSVVLKNILPVVLNEVGEPMRSKLAQVTLNDNDLSTAVNKLDVALALKDIEHIKKWLPKYGVNGAQRYSLYKIGAYKLIKQSSSNANFINEPWSAYGQQLNEETKDGFKTSDYYIANAHCDADYAKFLAEKGLIANEEIVIQAFFSRLFYDTPNPDMDVKYRLYKLPLKAVKASNQQCEKLIHQYKEVSITTPVLDDIANIVSAQMLTQYHELAEEEKNGKEFETAAAEDKFYDQLQFNQKTSPLPALPGMLTTLLADRPNAAAVCAALDTMPWLVSHVEGIKKFMDLASKWQKTNINNLDYLEDPYNCSPSLLMPPSLFPTETKERNQFLEVAEISCQVVTPNTKYVYSQTVECGDVK